MEEETGARGDGTPTQDRIFISVVILNPLLACSDAFPGLVNAWEMIALGWNEVNVLVRT